MSKQLTWMVPPSIVAAMGGAVRYAHDGTHAHVEMPGGEVRKLRMTRATFDLQSAFTLADLATPAERSA